MNITPLLDDSQVTKLGAGLSLHRNFLYHECHRITVNRECRHRSGILVCLPVERIQGAI